MVQLFVIIALNLSPLWLRAAQAELSVPAVLAVIDPQPKQVFESELQNRIASQLKNCRKCEVMNLTPYDSQGQFDPKGLKEQLDRLPPGNAVVTILWNKKFEPADQATIEKIRGLVRSGVLVVATAGKPEGQGPTLGLRRTLWGQVPEIMIIGDLTEKERLRPGTFFGPEMLTALKPTASVASLDHAALAFSARLVEQLKDKKATEWVDFLRNKKATSKRMWPQLEDFFGR